MVVRKILEQTLSAGSSSVIFTDADIPNSLIRVFSSNTDIIPISRTLSGTSLTVTYEPQTSNLDVAVEIVKAGLDIVNDLTSTDTDKALSAKQGKNLKDAIDSIVIPTVPKNITDLDDVDVSSIQDGQTLAWNDDESKFVNVDQSSSGIVFSSSEIVVGKWIDNKDLYQITYTYETVLPVNQNTFTTLISNTGLNVDTLVFGFTKPTKESVFTPIALQMSGDNLQGYFSSTWSIKNLTIYYTKTS